MKDYKLNPKRTTFDKPEIKRIINQAVRDARNVELCGAILCILTLIFLKNTNINTKICVMMFVNW